LTTFSGDSLQILLSWSVGVADLEEKTFLADGLPMELLDDLLTDVTSLKPMVWSVKCELHVWKRLLT